MDLVRFAGILAMVGAIVALILVAVNGATAFSGALLAASLVFAVASVARRDLP